MHLKFIFLHKVLFSQHSHPYLAQVAHLGDKEYRLLLQEVNQAIAIHLNDTEEVVEVCLLIRWVVEICAVERDIRGSLKECNSFVLFINLYLFFEKSEETLSILLEKCIRQSILYTGPSRTINRSEVRNDIDRVDLLLLLLSFNHLIY